MAELINRDDTLNQGRVKINESIKQSARAEVKADEALDTANEAKDQSESTQTQLDTIVIDGDSSVEAAQARVDRSGHAYTTLKERLDEENKKVTQQLAETVNILKSVENANSKEILPLVNHLGNTQNIHPKILDFKDRWNGYRYWMAYTPYPDGNVEHENPCIAVSHDMISWTVPSGLINPLDPRPSEGYNSDTHLIYREDTNVLEIWWRQYVNQNDRRIYRRTTNDGVNWGPKELVIKMPDEYGILDMLSPAVIFEDGKYKVWYCRAGTLSVYYRESIGDTISQWSNEEQVPINWWSQNLTPWHLDVIKTDLGYEFLVQAYDRDSGSNNTSDLYHVIKEGEVSEDVPVPNLVLSKSANLDAHDNAGIYRSSFLKDGEIYYLIYSGLDRRGKRSLSLSYGNDMKGLNGYSKNILKYRDLVDYDVIENYNVSNIDMLRFSGSTTPVVKSFSEGIADGQKLTLMIGTSSNKVLIKHSAGNIALPNNEDYLLDNNQRVLDLYYSSGYWRAAAYKPPKPKYAAIATDLNNYDVSDIDILYIQDHVTINSLAPSYFGKRIDIIVSKTDSSAIIKAGSNVVPPKNEDLILDINSIGITCVCTANGVWRCF